MDSRAPRGYEYQRTADGQETIELVRVKDEPPTEARTRRLENLSILVVIIGTYTAICGGGILAWAKLFL